MVNIHKTCICGEHNTHTTHAHDTRREQTLTQESIPMHARTHTQLACFSAPPPDLIPKVESIGSATDHPGLQIC